MRRKTWFALALAAVLAVSYAAGALAAKERTKANPRPKRVTQGLDYLHARQNDKGGFASMSSTAWGILGLVASGERPGWSAWTVKGSNPFDYLQAGSHEEAATSDTVDNAPVYYARAIMAYIAAGQPERVYIAGTPRVDLLADLYTYQDVKTDPKDSAYGSFSPSSSSPTFQAIHTTVWAILALHANGNGGDAQFQAAMTWLKSQQNSDGGFAAQPGNSANVTDTALAIQALELASPVPAGQITNARTYLKNHQRSDGGFPYTPSGTTDAQATSAAIQAIVAMGESQASWAVNGNTPAHTLGKLQRKNGSYDKRHNTSSAPLPTTSWALMALRNQPFTTFPASRPSSQKPFVFRPKVKTISPKNHAKYTSTRVVLIHATYTDGTGGTGIDPKACRVYVDDVNKTKPAVIGRSSLHLELKNVPNGEHTYRLMLVDYAGNAKLAERSFTVNVSTPVTPAPTPSYTYTPQPTHAPTYNPVPTHAPTYVPTTPTPSTTLYPSSPTPSTSGYPSYSPSPSTSGAPEASPSPSSSPVGAVGAGGSGGGGSAAGFVGGTLLAMLPIGAAISYLVYQRREQALDPAAQGTVLSGGGSAWDRVMRSLGKVKDLVKPARS
jgi:Prenyltransferase and squalene oxidase repeat